MDGGGGRGRFFYFLGPPFQHDLRGSHSRAAPVCLICITLFLRVCPLLLLLPIPLQARLSRDPECTFAPTINVTSRGLPGEGQRYDDDERGRCVRYPCILLSLKVFYDRPMATPDFRSPSHTLNSPTLLLLPPCIHSLPRHSPVRRRPLTRRFLEAGDRAAHAEAEERAGGAGG